MQPSTQPFENSNCPTGTRLVSDTVGFVRELPHELIEAFRSTLEEVGDADLLVHVVDASDADPDQQLATVRLVLNEIGASDVPELVVFNKIDVADATALARLRALHGDASFISARTGDGVPELLENIVVGLRARSVELELSVPYGRGDVLADLHATGDVLKEIHTDIGTDITVRIPNEDVHRFRQFAIDQMTEG